MKSFLLACKFFKIFKYGIKFKRFIFVLRLPLTRSPLNTPIWILSARTRKCSVAPIGPSWTVTYWTMTTSLSTGILRRQLLLPTWMELEVWSPCRFWTPLIMSSLRPLRNMWHRLEGERWNENSFFVSYIFFF